MSNLSSKSSVDQHVRQAAKKLSGEQLSTRGNSFAKLYARIHEYETARDWLQRYLDIKTEDAAGHRYMGEIYEHLGKPDKAITSYQRSFNINSKQNDLIKNICRLFLVDDNWSLCPGKARSWCEQADTENIRDDNVLTLRLKVLNKDKNGGGKPVEDMILKEIAARPHDIGLRIRMVQFLLDEKRVQEAFKYCFELEMKFMEMFLLSVDWYNTVSSVLAQHTPDSWNYWCLLLISLDKRIFLSLKKDLALQTIKQTNIKDVANLLYDFDQVLKKAADSLLILAPVKDLAVELINHFRGQMALNIASLIIQKQKVSSGEQWRDTIRKCLPLLLLALQSSTVNTDAFWLKNTNETIRKLFAHLKKEGAFRCAQAGRTVLACKLGGQKTLEDIFTQSREFCADLNWRKNVYRQLFSSLDKSGTSYLLQNSFFQEPIYKDLSFTDLESFENIAQHLFPSSLEHHVYLGLGRKDIHSYRSYTFNGLNLSTANLINCSPETINRIDVDSFLYCSIIQARRRLEAERDYHESFSSKPFDRPMILPAANMVEGLVTEEQAEWWLLAFKIHRNIAHGNQAQLRVTLQFGIEAVRGIDTVKIDTIILLKLGDILLASAESTEEKRHCDLRVENIYKQAIRQLKSQNSDNSRRLFKFQTSNFDLERVLDQHAEKAIAHISTIYFNREKYQELIEELTNVQNPWAAYYRAEAYKKLEATGKSRKLCSEKARESLIESWTLLENSSDKNQTLRVRIEKDLKKMQHNLQPDDLDFHNVSNGHIDDEEFHNASSTSFRGRRDLSMSGAVLPNYDEKFADIENLIRKFNDAVVTVKEDVLFVKSDFSDLREKLNDVSGLKQELLNIRTDIAECKRDTDKAIVDLNSNVSVLINILLGAAAPSPARFPPPANPVFNQMYNTAYPMFSQYPPPNMIQRPPHPGPGYDPNMMMAPAPAPVPVPVAGNQQKSSLMEALNNPSLLTTWNNTYNPQAMGPLTPPVVMAPSAFGNGPIMSIMSTPSAPMSVPAPVPVPVAPKVAPFVAPPTIQNKPVERTPPENVVITSSDPLPSHNTFVSQPTLSVTIPPQHIKHAPKPQYENISPVKNANDSGDYLEEPADYDPRPDFLPIIPLPDKIEVRTGEENEEVIFSERAKLFRHTENEWKERGIGNIKILKCKDSGKYRILMRREQIHKLCANHALTPDLDLKVTPKENQLMWVANDFSEDEMKTEKFLVRFKHNDSAKKFREAFENAKKVVSKIPKEPLKVQDDNTKVQATTPVVPNASKSAFSFGAFSGTGVTTAPALFPVAKDKDQKPPAQPSPFANFSFGQGASQNNKSFSELFGAIASPPKVAAATAQSTPVTKSPSTTSTAHEDEVEHYEPTAMFEPVIPLPDLVEAKTGEEDEKVRFQHRAKLLRFDKETKEWKERGIGEMKVLVHNTDTNKARLLMRREQIFKICCNMAITSDLKFKKLTANTYSFFGQDFSEGEYQTEMLAIKFKTAELIEEFVAAVVKVQNSLNSDPKPVDIPKKPEVQKKIEAQPPKPEATQGFGDKFKPKTGSWSCNGCYISNKPETLYCVACDSPKDDTVPKKEAKSLLAPASDAPKFSFGATGSGFSFGSLEASINPPVPTVTPASGSFSFGMPTAVQGPATIAPSTGSSIPTFGVPPPPTISSTNSSFAFGAKEPVAATAADSTTSGFTFGSFTFGAAAAAAPVVEKPVEPVASDSFNFVFKKKSPSKAPKSPNEKSRNDSVNSEGAGDEEENEYHEEEENQTYFQPAIALPDKIDVKTGEENEEVLYSHRAKLFRFVDKEWKERGLGDIKILKHSETGKLRVIMRREQIFKICLNFFLTDEIELNPKDDKSWTFGAGDFSEGEIEPTSFAVRFKNKEIAESFKKAIEDALARNSGTTQTGDNSELLKRLSLPQNFFDYLNAPDCSGCIGCKSDDYTYNPHEAIEFAADLKPLPEEPPVLKAKLKPRRQSVDKHVSFKLDQSASENGSTNVFTTGIKKSEATPNVFAVFNTQNPPNIFGAQPVGASPFGSSSIFSSSLNTTDGSKAAEPFSGGLFGSKANFTFGSGTDKASESANTPGIFGNSDPPPAITSGNIFGTNSASSFSFAEAAKELGNSPKDPLAVPDFLKNTNNFSGFATLASESDGKTWATSSANNSGGFYGLTVKDDFFSKNINRSSGDAGGEASQNDESGANDENYDPHYDPIITLPDEIQVVTGEEDEKKIYSERAKLYRYDIKTKEWKERGVGELKILHHPVNGTYRLLLRREQIYKLVLNLLISPEFHMSYMNNSLKSFCWAGMNYAEGGEAEQLAIRFKNEDLANVFKKQVDECMSKLMSRENLQPEND